jgi:3'(2'), 5'-bisphosphate nucleotidase
MLKVIEMARLNIDKLLEVATEAGKIIMSYYDKPIEVSIKDDNSPVTIADLEANNLIVKTLYEITPNWNIISEEGFIFNETNDKEYFWLVDPLDGTRGFIKHNNEFTVNIGLIHKNKPIIGVIYVPFTETLYYSDGTSSFKLLKNQDPIKISARYLDKTNQVIIASLDKPDQKTIEYINSIPNRSVLSATSSLKFCLLAEGVVDIYPRFGKTGEWDTAAGHAILNSAGGSLLNMDGSELDYGKPNFENSSFIAQGKRK